ncbi:Hypothetical protein D9617_32g091820 [Elsinoe fawcettii]|nr:Hypothetical protein D9617_32g091820 [Elsinoe fawcettii]
MPPNRSRDASSDFAPAPNARQAFQDDAAVVADSDDRPFGQADSTNVYLEALVESEIPSSQRNRSVPTHFTKRSQITRYELHVRDVIRIHPLAPRQPDSPGSQLLCRSKHIIHYAFNSGHRHQRSKLKAWTTFDESEIPAGPDRVDDFQTRQTSKTRRRARNDPIAQRARGKGATYPSVDLFCGAGFFSEGAKLAGFSPIWACNCEEVVIRSYRNNHLDAEAKISDYKDFVDCYGPRLEVDVLLISFPCKFWSPAHTTPGRNDDANQAALLGLEYILQKINPRLVVLEQTYGLSHIQHRDWLMAMMAMFRNCDYSVKMATFDFRSLNCPSDRTRMISLGAAPGETLPDFPQQTRDRRNKPSIWDVLKTHDRTHRSHAPFNRDRGDRLLYDPHVRYAKTITASNRMQHWFGGVLTPYQGMKMIGAKDEYVLRGSETEQWAQVGNAFPPVVAEKSLRKCFESLARTDREDERRARTWG